MVKCANNTAKTNKKKTFLFVMPQQTKTSKRRDYFFFPLFSVKKKQDKTL